MFRATLCSSSGGQVVYLPKLYEDARSEKYNNTLVIDIVSESLIFRWIFSDYLND